MDNPTVSAFAVYSTTKKQKPKRNKKKNKVDKNALSPKVLKEDMIRKLGMKLKKKQKAVKESKNIINKKSLKKQNKVKKSKKNKQNNTKTILNGYVEDEFDDDVPELISIPIREPNSDNNNYDLCSHSTMDSFEFDPVITDSSEEAMKVLKWIIAPFDPDEFLKEVWEKKPLHIARNKPHYYNDIISTPTIDNMLRNENIQFTKNIDITSYINGKRETHNPGGRAYPPGVWDSYLNGCSIRLLNPQIFISRLHHLNATLQEFFHSFVGANAYLTPPDSQGFAPHYDDIEAFILQAEGKKKWRIYKPRAENEILPRVSSKNFTDDEIGDPVMEVVLEAGDLLYFPRGYIHQAVTIDGEHSLHVTVSMYQNQAWADLFEKMLPASLQMAINNIVDFRQGVPFDIFDNFGLVHSDVLTPRKNEIIKIIHRLFDKIKNNLLIDDAVDQMCKKFQQQALPPVLNDLEKAVTIYGDTDVMIENGQIINRVEISLDTRIRLLRKNIIRVVSEEQIRIYFYTENSLENDEEFSCVEIEKELIPALETLVTTYPEYVSVENLNVADDLNKLQVADTLWGRGLIMTEYPLDNIDDD